MTESVPSEISFLAFNDNENPCMSASFYQTFTLMPSPSPFSLIVCLRNSHLFINEFGILKCREEQKRKEREPEQLHGRFRAESEARWPEKNQGLPLISRYLEKVTLPGCASVSLSVVLVAQLCPTLCNPWTVACQGSSVHRILQARILGRVAMLSSISICKMGIKAEFTLEFF